MKKITFVVAPGIPMAEAIALQTHVDEAGTDPDYTVVTNYEVKTVEIDDEEFLLTYAEGVPVAEVLALRAKIDRIKQGGVPPVIVVNYELETVLLPRV